MEDVEQNKIVHILFKKLQMGLEKYDFQLLLIDMCGSLMGLVSEEPEIADQ